MQEQPGGNTSLTEKETSDLIKAKTRQALINQDVMYLKTLGFNNDEIQSIYRQNPIGFDRLMNQSTRFVRARITFEVDHEKFSEVLNEMNYSLDELNTIQKLVSYEAPKAMMMCLFGMSVEKFKFWRCIYGLDKRGRAPAPTVEEKSAIWDAWNRYTHLELVDRLIMIYEETKVPLRSVWSEIHSWAEHPEKYLAFDHKSRFILKNRRNAGETI